MCPGSRDRTQEGDNNGSVGTDLRCVWAALFLLFLVPKLVEGDSNYRRERGGDRDLQVSRVLSYNHRDTRWGKWLHRALEGYHIDRDLIGRAGTAGPVPKTLRPIFRDREDFSGAQFYERYR